MKDEDEKMQEFMKDFTNAHGKLPKSKWIDPVFRFAEKLLKITIVVGIIIIIIMMIPLTARVYEKAVSNLMTMDKRSFIKKIEKTYKQKVEIIQDDSTYKGNGKMTLRTLREPQIEFSTGKNIYDHYILDYEDKALLYYARNDKDGLFSGLEIEEGTKALRYSQFGSVELLECKGYLPIEGYGNIEEGVHQLLEIKKFMIQKLKQFKVSLRLKIGEYISSYDYNTEKGKKELSEEEIILKEKQTYLWYLKENGKDFSFIPEGDLFEIDKPKVLDVYVNGERIVDIHGPVVNDQVSYAIATYDQDKKYYETNISSIIAKCDKFQMLSNNPNTEFDFIYQGKKYRIHYLDDKTRGNKVPAVGNIEVLEQVLGIKLEYDYRNKKVNLVIP